MPTDHVPLPFKTPRGTGFALTALTALVLLFAGALLWNEQGAAVFTALVSAALAWCF